MLSKTADPKRDHIINGFAALIIGFSFIILIHLVVTNRSLWSDEAKLAFSLCQRNLFDLFGKSLEWNQIAPVLYLLLAKLMTLLLGNTEFALRVLSLIAYVGTLYIAYQMLQDVIPVKYPLLGVAYISSGQMFLYYANEFKPYMTDCFSVMLTIYLYSLYSQGKIKFRVFVAVSFFVVWLSFPSIFFIGSIYIYETVIAIKNRKASKMITASAIVGISFLVQYFVWLKPTSQSSYMLNFWHSSFLPIFPRNLSQMKMALHLVMNLVSDHFDYLKLVSTRMGVIVFAAFVFGLVLNLVRKSRTTHVILGGYFLLLVASSLSKYPLANRMILFSVPLSSIFVLSTIDFAIQDRPKLKPFLQNITIFLLIAVFFWGHIDSAKFLISENRLVSYNEINPLVDYLDDNMTEKDRLYVYSTSIPPFLFRNSYNRSHFGKNIDPSVENVILGENAYNETLNADDIETIIRLDRCYILVSHSMIWDKDLKNMLATLNDLGWLQKVAEYSETPLYLFRQFPERNNVN